MDKASLPLSFDTELDDLTADLRWREWMGRVEAAIFPSSAPLPREDLARLVGVTCVLDELINDIKDELKQRPYELVFVASGWQHRTRPRFKEAIRAASKTIEPEGPELSKLETMVVTVIAYYQPIPRLKISEMLGREISRDTIARLKRIGLIGAGPRIAQPGAPLSYVTTKEFLERFGLATLQDLPDMEVAENFTSPNAI